MCGRPGRLPRTGGGMPDSAASTQSACSKRAPKSAAQRVVVTAIECKQLQPAAPGAAVPPMERTRLNAAWLDYAAGTDQASLRTPAPHAAAASPHLKSPMAKCGGSGASGISSLSKQQAAPPGSAAARSAGTPPRKRQDFRRNSDSEQAALRDAAPPATSSTPTIKQQQAAPQRSAAAPIAGTPPRKRLDLRGGDSGSEQQAALRNAAPPATSSTPTVKPPSVSCGPAASWGGVSRRRLEAIGGCVEQPPIKRLCTSLSATSSAAPQVSAAAQPPAATQLPAAEGLSRQGSSEVPWHSLVRRLARGLQLRVNWGCLPCVGSRDVVRGMDFFFNACQHLRGLCGPVTLCAFLFTAVVQPPTFSISSQVGSRSCCRPPLVR